MKWRNSKERELLSTGGTRELTLPNKSNPNPDLSDVAAESMMGLMDDEGREFLSDDGGDGCAMDSPASSPCPSSPASADLHMDKSIVDGFDARREVVSEGETGNRPNQI